MSSQSAFIRKAAATSLVALLMAALLLLIGYAANFFLLVFGGILIGVLLSSLASFLHRKTGLGYGLSLAAVVLLLLGLTLGTSWLLAPTVNQQAEQLSQSIPQALKRLENSLSQTSWGQ